MFRRAVGREQGCCSVSYKAQDRPPLNKELYHPKMSLVLRKAGYQAQRGGGREAVVIQVMDSDSTGAGRRGREGLESQY